MNEYVFEHWILYERKYIVGIPYHLEPIIFNRLSVFQKLKCCNSRNFKGCLYDYNSEISG